MFHFESKCIDEPNVVYDMTWETTDTATRYANAIEFDFIQLTL